MEGEARYELTRADLIEQLKEQIAFLELSGKAFDEGAEGEAKRLATTIRVLVHDTRTSKALLTHLAVKEQLGYMDTASPIIPDNLAPTPGLVVMQMSNAGMTYSAPLADFPPPRNNPPKLFAAWWTDPVTKDSAGELFSRKDYVLNMSNKEGGAHVDHSLDARYANLTRNNSFGWIEHGPGYEEGKPVTHNPALPSVRQIAYETESTLKRHPMKLGLY